MQNDPHCSCFSLGTTLGPLEEAFLRAHAHAPTVPHTCRAASPTSPISTADGSDDDVRGDELFDDDDEPLFDGDELLRAAREPIEWLLTLAHRLAANEPEEVAAIDRLRAAYHSRIAGRAIGVRMSDVLIAFGLVLGALDRNVVLEGVTRTIADGVSTLLTFEGVALASQLALVADRVSAPTIHHARNPRQRRSRAARRTPL